MFLKKILFVIWLSSFAVLGFAQDKKEEDKKISDFSGTWIIDKEKTGPESGFMLEPFSTDITMVIVTNETEINISRKSTLKGGKEIIENIVFFTDGRRMSVGGKLDDDNFRIIELKGRKLIKQDTFVLKKGEGMDWFVEKSGKKQVKLNNKEVWEISKDGNTLTQKISGGSLPGVPISVFKYVFRRQT